MLQHMYLRSIFVKFGDSMVTLRWVFRELKIAIFVNRGYPVLPGGKLLEHFFFPAALASAVIQPKLIDKNNLLIFRKATFYIIYWLLASYGHWI